MQDSRLKDPGIHNSIDHEHSAKTKAMIPRVPGGRRRTSYYNKQRAVTKDADDTDADEQRDSFSPKLATKQAMALPTHLEARRKSSVPPVDLNAKIDARNRRPALYNTCAPILEKDPHMRTDAECHAILEMLKYVRFLKPLSKEQQVNLCRVMRLQEVPFAGEEVVTQGDEGHSMFIVLVGSFSVSIEEPTTLEDADLDMKSTTTNTLTITRPSTIVGYLHQGHHFGEVALNEDAPRNATVMSAENSCELLRIERRDYEMAKKIQVQLAKEKADFLHSIPFFADMPWSDVDDLAKRCFYESLPVGKVLCSQGDQVDPLRFLPIVHHGECLVVQRVAFQVKKRKPFQFQGGGRASPPFSPRNQQKRASVVSPGMGRPNKYGRKVPALSSLMKNFGLCTMGKKGFFLEEAMLAKKEEDQIRMSTLVAVTPLEVLWLSSYYWKTLIMKDPKLVASFPTWQFRYPSQESTRRLWAEASMWGQFKQKLMEDVQ